MILKRTKIPTTALMLLMFISSTHSEIFKGQNATHIDCTDDDIDSTIYILPPLEKLQSNLDLLKDVKWDDDDWILKSSTDVPIAPVTDKRWEDFPLIANDYHHFNFSGSKSVSVLSPVVIEIYTYNSKNAGIYKMFDLKESAKWYHFSVVSKNNRVLIYRDDIVIHDKQDFGITDVVFRSRSTTYWKVHEYNFMWLNKATESDPTIVKVPATGKSCLILYTLLCEECSLKIVSTGETTIFNSTKKTQNGLNNWQTNKIAIKPDHENLIAIYGENYGISTGYWALNFGLCASENSVTYKIPSEATTTEYTCHRLGNHHQHYKNKKSLTIEAAPAYKSTCICASGQCQGCENNLGGKVNWCTYLFVLGLAYVYVY